MWKQNQTGMKQALFQLQRTALSLIACYCLTLTHSAYLSIFLCLMHIQSYMQQKIYLFCTIMDQNVSLGIPDILLSSDMAFLTSCTFALMGICDIWQFCCNHCITDSVFCSSLAYESKLDSLKIPAAYGHMQFESMCFHRKNGVSYCTANALQIKNSLHWFSSPLTLLLLYLSYSLCHSSLPR